MTITDERREELIDWLRKAEHPSPADAIWLEPDSARDILAMLREQDVKTDTLTPESDDKLSDLPPSSAGAFSIVEGNMPAVGKRAYAIRKQPGVGPQYLQRDGTVAHHCGNGWFPTVEDAEKAVREHAASQPDYDPARAAFAPNPGATAPSEGTLTITFRPYEPPKPETLEDVPEGVWCVDTEGDVCWVDGAGDVVLLDDNTDYTPDLIKITRVLGYPVVGGGE